MSILDDGILPVKDFIPNSAFSAPLSIIPLAIFVICDDVSTDSSGLVISIISPTFSYKLPVIPSVPPLRFSGLIFLSADSPSSLRPLPILLATYPADPNISLGLVSPFSAACRPLAIGSSMLSENVFVPPGF